MSCVFNFIKLNRYTLVLALSSSMHSLYSAWILSFWYRHIYGSQIRCRLQIILPQNLTFHAIASRLTHFSLFYVFILAVAHLHVKRTENGLCMGWKVQELIASIKFQLYTLLYPSLCIGFAASWVSFENVMGLNATLPSLLIHDSSLWHIYLLTKL